jgi:hypothetical protein
VRGPAVIEDVGLMDVLLTPMKALAAGECAADYINPEFIAHTITLLDFDTFSHIPHLEFFNKRFQMVPRPFFLLVMATKPAVTHFFCM